MKRVKRLDPSLEESFRTEVLSTIDPSFWDLIKSAYDALVSARSLAHMNNTVKRDLDRVLKDLEKIPSTEGKLHNDKERTENVQS